MLDLMTTNTHLTAGETAHVQIDNNSKSMTTGKSQRCQKVFDDKQIIETMEILITYKLKHKRFWSLIFELFPNAVNSSNLNDPLSKSLW